jgi:predicted N-formylglutamate amidohydrolase
MQATDAAFLAAEEPAPVRVLRPEGRSPFFLTADHAGRLIPARLGTLGLDEAERTRHIAWDIGIAGVTERLSEALGATAVLQPYSRLVIDCNHDPAAADSIAEVSESTAVPGNRALSAPERKARRAAIFDLYHGVIAALLDQRRMAAQTTLFVAMHSFTPVFKREARAMQVGVLYNRDKRLARSLLVLLRAEGDLIVGDNAPYRVSDATDYDGMPVHAERRGLAHVEIEIRQDLITGEAGQVEWAARLARLLPEAMGRLEGEHAGPRGRN